MGLASPRKDRVPALARTIAKFAAAWSIPLLFFSRGLDRLAREVLHAILAGFPSAERYAVAVYSDFVEILGTAFALTLFFGTGLAVLGAVARMLARARIRAGQPDFLDPIRRWVASHPRMTRALTAAPGIAFVVLAVWPGPHELEHLREMIGPYARAATPIFLGGWGIYAMARKGLRSLLAPTASEADAPARFEISPDEIAFDAVAVTRETLATVALFAAIMLAVPTLIWMRPIQELFTERAIFYAVGAYMALAAVVPYAFRKASRISVGVDGVHVRGTSRARFFAYRDIDSARSNGSDLELVRAGSVVLRLQLHGEDAARRGAILARIQDNLARVREGRGAAAAQLVATSSKEDLARVAHGAGDYRIATLTREQLWALVEGPEIEASARRAAAEALVRSSARGEETERARLRVAAERCAEPQVRIALEEIALVEPDGPEAGAQMGLPPVGR